MTKTIYETHQTGHWKELFESKNKLLGGHNLLEDEELCATIKSVASEEVYDIENKGTKFLVVLTFENGIPPMAMNVTNADTIALMYGNSYPQWTGKKILIHRAKVKAFGKVHDALRVRPVVPRDNEDLSQYQNKLEQCKTLDELKAVFLAMPKHIQGAMTKAKDDLKGKLS